MPVPKLGEVLIRVHAFSLDGSDVHASTVPADRIIGKGAAGKIVAVGEDVPAWRLGDVVIVDPGLGSREGTSGLFGVDRDGAAAEFITVNAIDACPISAEVPIETLPLLAFYYSLAERVLTWARLYPDEAVFILGADTPVGMASVELAQRRKAKVTVQTLGKNSDFSSGKSDGVITAIEDFPDGTFDVVVDFRAVPNHSDCGHLLRDGGVYVSRNGDVVKPPSEPVSALVDVDIFTAETLEHVARMAESGVLEPRSPMVISMRDVEEQLRRLDLANRLDPLIVKVEDH
ncbi:alcohol dehydrogenase catalytic domain-containing protein [Rhizobium ruizarguesonis]|uniref:alcohol dehydrogenase catalytic domain-containing protein n=1 Tax=Rhizobium TaxID=379 RepID=UPI0013BF6FD3|nr:alcohol dehydrogenase catalytic domain-containing protein [Rhizobium ruizarguesonis]MBY5828599.1 alcohol dehydrogenase catalytic domain-containing protein [Rhizobium leguminosarum]MBY5856336.1 alcohol dehydrogenase catalytic domain-containing protein [Rhizobium leguminosarum]NEI96523.1 alcohol dehydrogenase catalytic domain-containing protein [Rhizobium ruizarguesonis]NEJ33854.1 alcohol dehydrogenase catalytic domain-containing protein [Rhizobium ruizarguesonis]